MDPYKLLIADDEPHIRAGISALDWESIGVQVCAIANNGKEAIDMASLCMPDIILTDIRMPITDGLEMAEQILARNSDCMIIFLSGYEDFEYVKRALKMGACDYILKPAAPGEILNCCREALKQLRDKREHIQAYQDLRSMVARNEDGREEGKETREHHGDLRESRINSKEIRFYIENNYGKDLSLNDLSELFHFNSIYINRILKKDTGYTFLEILNNKRMAVSLRLLEETDLKVSRIAEQVGIPDQRYFSTIFKKYYGCSPKQYKQNMKRKGI